MRPRTLTKNRTELSRKGQSHWERNWSRVKEKRWERQAMQHQAAKTLMLVPGVQVGHLHQVSKAPSSHLVRSSRPASSLPPILLNLLFQFLSFSPILLRLLTKPPLTLPQPKTANRLFQPNHIFHLQSVDFVLNQDMFLKKVGTVWRGSKLLSFSQTKTRRTSLWSKSSNIYQICSVFFHFQTFMVHNCINIIYILSLFVQAK